MSLDRSFFELVNTSPDYLNTEEIETLRTLLEIKIVQLNSRADDVEQYRSDDTLAKILRHEVDVFKSILKKIS